MKKKGITIALCSLVVMVGVSLTLFFLERNDRLKLQKELKEISNQIEEIIEPQPEKREVWNAEDEKYQFIFSPLDERDYKDIMQNMYLSKAETVAYKVPYENETFKCEIPIPSYEFLFPIGAVESYNKATQSYETWIMVAWGGATGALYDTVGWIKQEQPMKLSETSKMITLFDKEAADEDVNIVLRKCAEKVEAIVKETFSPRAETGYFAHIFETDEDSVRPAYVMNVKCTLTAARAPEDDPLIVGMYRALEMYSEEEQRKAAQKIIDGFIAEINPLGKRSQWAIQVKAIPDESGEIKLMHIYYENGEKKEQPLEDYLVKEDSNRRIQLGIDTLTEYMQKQH